MVPPAAAVTAASRAPAEVRAFPQPGSKPGSAPGVLRGWGCASRPGPRAGLSDRTLAWLFVGPTIALLLAFNIFPLLWTIWLSFTNYRANRPNAPTAWVGLGNYQRVLEDEAIWEHLRATAHFLCSSIALQLLLGFALVTQAASPASP